MSGHSNVSLREILPQAIILRLSREARLVYESIWNSWSYKNVTGISLSPEIVSKRSRVGLWAIQAATDELERFGLLKCRPNGDRTEYEYSELA